VIKEVKADRTLLVNGPASVRLVSGEAKIFDAPLNVGETSVVRDGKRVPFYVKKEASFDITHGKNSVVEDADGDTIPTSWHKTAEDILALEKPTVVIIVGEVDSGKTSLCTFFANSAIKANRAVAAIDADLGQSDIGPPATIGLAYINNPVRDLFYVKAEDTDFVGFTSPSGVEKHVVNCIANFKKRALQGNRNFLVINTDGWVEGEEAVQYKAMLTETIGPNAVVGIEREKELVPILGRLKKTRVLTVEPSTAVKKRDRERRKTLRELSYKKYLRNAKVEAFPLNWTKIEGTQSSPSLFLTNERLKRIEKTLGIQPVFCKETVESIWVVLRRSQRVDFERLYEADEVFKKRVKVVQKGDEKGLVVGLHDEENKFLGLGIICDMDYRRKFMKVYTPVTQKVATIRVGKVRLDDVYREIDTNATFWS
jgi:polynucleotide 5'-hydroxyl-kinase GRC3/NOL9